MPSDVSENCLFCEDLLCSPVNVKIRRTEFILGFAEF